MTPKEYRSQEIKKFLESKKDSVDKSFDTKTITTEMYVKERNLISYEDCKRALKL